MMVTMMRMIEVATTTLIITIVESVEGAAISVMIVVVDSFITIEELSVVSVIDGGNIVGDGGVVGGVNVDVGGGSCMLM